MQRVLLPRIKNDTQAIISLISSEHPFLGFCYGPTDISASEARVIIAPVNPHHRLVRPSARATAPGRAAAQQTPRTDCIPPHAGPAAPRMAVAPTGTGRVTIENQEGNCLPPEGEEKSRLASGNRRQRLAAAAT